MAYIRHQDAHEHFSDRVLEGLRQQFPVEGRKQTLRLDGLEVADRLHPDDLRSQYDAKINGQTWASSVHATLSLIDNATGRVVDTRKMKIAELPQITHRYSYIVDGQEYQMDNQWQLKPGVYARRRLNGELESRFNVIGRSDFDLVFHPETKQFVMEYHDSKIPLYPIMHAMGVSDSSLEHAWGKEILAANKEGKRVAGALDQFAKTTKRSGEAPKDSALHVQQVMAESKLNPDATELTLGKRFTAVTGDALQSATARLLKVQAGHPPDDRDSLVFKTLRSVGDYAVDALQGAKRDIRLKLDRKINTATSIRDIVKGDTFNKPLREVFTKNSAARIATQINPAEMISASLQTTILGTYGGIKSEQSVTDEAKLINPSHFGFLDPINTPESAPGVTLRLASGVKKVGTEPKIPLYNLKTGKVEEVGPKEAFQSNVVLADQVKWVGDKPVALAPSVKMLGPGNEPTAGKLSDAQYVMRRPTHFLNITTNLIPFVNNTNGARAGYASRHIEQAISLLNREAPLVQAATGVAGELDTFDKLVGSNMAAHRAPVQGTVTQIKHDGITIADSKGRSHEVQIYHNFPLNDPKSLLHSEPLVKVGDKVKAGQVIADTNYARNGTLALGTNLTVGFLPYKGYNFEDGLVIGEGAAKKLSSQHMYKHELQTKEGTILDLKKYQVQHPETFTRDQYKHIGDDGVIKVGTKVNPGDPLVVAMRPFQLRDATGMQAIRKSISGTHTDASLKWEGDHEGEVVGVHRAGDKVVVHVKTVEPMQVGDKLSTRGAGKGIVTAILPDHEMPHTKDGKPIDVAFNPSGLPGRMNLGQVLEVAAGKIAQKTGKTYIVNNFETGTHDVLEKVQKELAQHKLSDTEELIDPLSKKSLGSVLVGPLHMFKLVHQVDKKIAVRPGMTLPGVTSEAAYSPTTLQPAGGGHEGGQSIGSLGTYALLAHGARANLREMQSYKAEGPDPRLNPAKAWPSQHNQIWAAIQTGTPLPPPRPTFAFRKFENMLKGAGINIEKKGHDFILGPLTDKHVLELSNGELKDPTKAVAAKLNKENEPQPLPQGIFDERITGGHGGNKWSHITLAEPLPNPIFEGPIKHLTGLKKTEYEDILYGRKAVAPNGKLVDTGFGVTGGAGIEVLLNRIDVPTSLRKAESELKKAPLSKTDKTLKQVKYLRALQQLGMKNPSEAYMLHYLPVLPPSSRPLSVLQSGDIKYDDINGLYRQFGQVNAQLKDPTLQAVLSDKRKESLRKDFYDGIKAVMGVHIPYEAAPNKGLLHVISGATPKTGMFQDVLAARRQDLSMRSTIVPEPALGLDEVGLPQHAALKLFAPFLVRNLVQMGGAAHALDAQKKISAVINGSKDPLVLKALERTMAERPVLMKRDPALHKYSVQAFKSRPTEGSAIKIHPLICSGMGADFDGDTTSIYVPITSEAVQEAHKMFPSNNLFSEATGKLMYQPSNESVLGLYKLSVTGRKTSQKFSSPEDALRALHAGKVRHDDIVQIAGKDSTPGRALLASAFPESMRSDILHDLSMRFSTKGMGSLLMTVAKQHKADFGEVANKVKDLGNWAATGLAKDPESGEVVPVRAHTLSLKDFAADKESRDSALRDAAKKISNIVATPGMSHAEKEHKSIAVWEEAGDAMRKAHEAKMAANPNNLFSMYQAGVKPKWEQYKQMALAPMLMQDSQGRVIPNPVTKSYGEGLDIAGYWTHLHGTRRGLVRKVQEVQDPGYLTKLMQSTTSHLSIDTHDCGTKQGIALPISDPGVHDRYLQQDVRAGNLHIPAGTLLGADVVGAIRSADKNAQVVVRSPLRCESDKGICATCSGLSSEGTLPPIGTAVGVQAVHALGERAVQLTLKSFHTGGVTVGGGGMASSLDRLMQLTYLPSKIPNAAALAMKGGTIEKIEKDPTGTRVRIDGVDHFVGKDAFGHSLATSAPGIGTVYHNDRVWSPPKVGMKVEAGQTLSDPSRTVVNPHDLYAATKSVEKLQNHLTNEIYRLYRDEGVKRKHVEVVVKAMTAATKVKDPGSSTLLKGEIYPFAYVNKLNQELKDKIVHEPVIHGVEMLPHDLLTDWMAKMQPGTSRLRNTLLDAAATLGKSSIHGPHPIPALAYGAEFGLTSEHAHKPGLGHLADVPKHHY